jgi:hypothetical protein
MAKPSRTLSILAVLVALLLVTTLYFLLRSGGVAADANSALSGEQQRVAQRTSGVDANEHSSAATRASVPAASDAASEESSKRNVGGPPLLRVQVVALENGRPLAGEHVLVYSKDGKLGSPASLIDSSRGRMLGADEQSEAPKTDDDGWAEIDVVADRELVASVEPAKFGRAQIDVPPLAPSERRDIVLEVPTANDILFYGRLIDAGDRRPIHDALVVLDHQPKHEVAGAPIATQTARTDSAGLFQLAGASWRRDVVSVSAPGFGPTTLRLVRGHETPGQARVILLAAGAEIRATVLDGAGAPLAGAIVTATADPFRADVSSGIVDWTVARPMRRTSSTDPDGRCTLSDLPPESPLELRAEWQGSPPQILPEPVTLSAGESRAIQFRIGGGATILGQIVDQHGKPVASHAVWKLPADKTVRHLFHQSEGDETGETSTKTSTDQEGRFAFESVPPGRWWIGPAPRPATLPPKVDESLIAPVGDLVTLEANELTKHVLIRADRGLFITGRVVRSSSGAASPAAIYAYPQFALDPWLATGTTDEGEFTLGPLPAGEWTLSAEAFGSMFGGGDEQRVVSGQTGVVLTLPEGGAIRGRVLGAGPSAIEDVEVWLMSRDLRNGAGALVDDERNYEWRDLPPGTYDIVARTRQGLSGVRSGVVVAEGSMVEEADVRLSPGAKLTVTIEGPADDWFVQISDGDVMIGVAWFEFGPSMTITVPAGTLRAELRKLPQRNEPTPLVESKTVTLEVGSEKSVVFKTGD